MRKRAQGCGGKRKTVPSGKPSIKTSERGKGGGTRKKKDLPLEGDIQSVRKKGTEKYE